MAMTSKERMRKLRAKQKLESAIIACLDHGVDGAVVLFDCRSTIDTWEKVQDRCFGHLDRRDAFSVQTPQVA